MVGRVQFRDDHDLVRHETYSILLVALCWLRPQPSLPCRGAELRNVLDREYEDGQPDKQTGMISEFYIREHLPAPESFYGSPPDLSLAKSSVLKPAPGRISRNKLPLATALDVIGR